MDKDDIKREANRMTCLLPSFIRATVMNRTPDWRVGKISCDKDELHFTVIMVSSDFVLKLGYQPIKLLYLNFQGEYIEPSGEEEYDQSCIKWSLEEEVRTQAIECTLRRPSAIANCVRPHNISRRF